MRVLDFARRLDNGTPMFLKEAIVYTALAGLFTLGACIYKMHRESGAYEQSVVQEQKEYVSQPVALDVHPCVREIVQEITRYEMVAENDKRILAEGNPQRMQLSELRTQVGSLRASGVRIAVDGTFGKDAGRLYSLDILNAGTGEDQVPDQIIFRVNGSEYDDLMISRSAMQCYELRDIGGP